MEGGSGPQRAMPVRSRLERAGALLKLEEDGPERELVARWREARAEKAPRLGGRRPARAVLGRRMEGSRRVESSVREMWVRAAMVWHVRGWPAGVD